MLMQVTVPFRCNVNNHACAPMCLHLIPRPFPPPVFDRLQYIGAILQAIKNWRWERPGNEAFDRLQYYTASNQKLEAAVLAVLYCAKTDGGNGLGTRLVPTPPPYH